MIVKTAVILAGGLGTRLRGTVPNLPKPMAPINDRPFLEYLIDYWISQGINRFILSIGYLKDVFIDHFGENYKNACIEYFVEEEPLGTGGGLLLASKDLTEPFIVINGDTFIEVDLDSLCSFHEHKDSGWTLSLFQTTQSERYMGIGVNQNDEIVSLNLELDKSINLANGGVYLINPKLLDTLGYRVGSKVSLEDELLPSFISKKGRLFGKEFNGRFIDIGLPSDYFQAEKIITQLKN